ncbi:11 kDa late embryogenesis abundant protein-like [Lycium barbarum]|uniref:11 kDa late embryogenesis abundant protein-like n=1 Tax=Lycium barbarum TaxID=112863 RepID=UPI00293E3B5B|nr:11 kDa late embryogenesis abundant protein-like [Lycium barbarum]
MEAAKETAANVAASANSGMEKTKAIVAEKAEKLTTSDPVQRQMATEKKEERIHQAEMDKLAAQEQNAASRQVAATGGTTAYTARVGVGPGHTTGTHATHGTTTGHTTGVLPGGRVAAEHPIGTTAGTATGPQYPSGTTTGTQYPPDHHGKRRSYGSRP